MSAIPQSKLQHHVHMLVINGQLPQVQSALAGVGYDAAGLEAGGGLLQAWLAGQARVKSVLANQKRATQAEREARQAAQAEINRFSQTVRILFGQDEPLLTSLGLRPHRTRSNGHPEGSNGANGSTEPTNGKAAHHLRRSRSAAETIAYWRLLLTNAQTINGQHGAHLAAHGWNSERLASAVALVEDYVAAEINQQQQAQAYQAELTAAKEAETALRRWYGQAARLSKLALQQTNPATQEQLKVLLGL